MTTNDCDWPPEADPEVFHANLDALCPRDERLAERLCWPVKGDHVFRAEDGSVSYLVNDTSFPLTVGAPWCDAELASLFHDGNAAPDEVLVFGVGRGEIVERLLERDDVRVVAWERDPWLLRLLLGRLDLREPLGTGRLRLALGSDLLRLVGTTCPRIEHPLLAEVYRWERSVLAQGLGDRRAFLCSGRLYVESLRRGLEARGYSVWPFDVERLSVEELEHTFDVLEPELIASINYRDGLSDFADRRRVPLCVWEIDPSLQDPGSPARSTRRTRIHTYRRANVDAFRRRGFDHVEYLPLAADTSLRRPLELSASERARYAARISFVGSSVARNVPEFRSGFAELHRRWSGAEHAVGLALFDALFERQLLDLERWSVPEHLEQLAPGFGRWAREVGDGDDPEALVGEAAAARKRATWIASLAEHGVDVWGDEGWRSIDGNGVRYRGPATHYTDLTRIYNASAINLDVGRVYQSDIVTMRVYDIVACRAFVLAEHSRALEEVFDVGREIESYRSLAELTDKARYYLAHPLEARAIAERGYRAVLERHTFEHRVGHMLDDLAEIPAPEELRVRVAG